MNKKIAEEFGIFSIFVCVTTFILSFSNTAFIPACMLWLSLLVFDICYYIKDNKKKKKLLYILFVFGVLLIIASLVYMLMRQL